MGWNQQAHGPAEQGIDPDLVCSAEQLEAASALPHPLEELLGRFAFDHGVGDGCDGLRLGKLVEQRKELFGSAGTEPKGDLPAYHFAFALNPAAFDAPLNPLLNPLLQPFLVPLLASLLDSFE